MKTWQMQEAKAKFSELIKYKALTHTVVLGIDLSRF